MHHEHDHYHHHDHEHHHHDHDHHHHDHDHHHEHHHTPVEELVALMHYMVGHNAAHARELAELAHQLAHSGKEEVYDKVMSAVADFDRGNEKIAEVLHELGC